jgi:hypothetical protein
MATLVSTDGQSVDARLRHLRAAFSARPAPAMRLDRLARSTTICLNTLGTIATVKPRPMGG